MAIKIAFVGDIVGKPGREMIKYHLEKIKEQEGIDFVVANGENASHGFGLTPKNANELFSYGVDLITGGNHSWDKKEIIGVLEQKDSKIIRPLNYKNAPGSGIYKTIIKDEKVAFINLLGHFSMPLVENAFYSAKDAIEILKLEGIKTIFIDFHAETTSEKRAMYIHLRSQISALLGTHTHIGCDDLTIEDGVLYISDIGLTGCRDGVIGVESSGALKRFLTGMPQRLEIPKSCKKILQMIVIQSEDGVVKSGYKIKAYDFNSYIVSMNAFVES